jgi:exosome complex component RRP46
MNSDGSSRNIIHNPTVEEFQGADSVHVLAFTSHGQLLVEESEGSFTLEDWNEIYEVAKSLCCDGLETEGNVMQGDELKGNTGGMMMFIKSTIEEKVSADLHWKD